MELSKLKLKSNYVNIGMFDIDGVLRGKKIHKNKFQSALESGFGFCDVIFGWDINDTLYDDIKFSGWHTGYPDIQAAIVQDSMRKLPFGEDNMFFLAHVADKENTICPRNLLNKVIDKYKEHNIDITSAFEYEFFTFQETAKSANQKNYQNLEPLTIGNFGYSAIRQNQLHEFHDELLTMLDVMDIPLEGLHTETGPGVIEAALCKQNAMLAADNAALFKTYTKIFAQRRDLLATFMARWSNQYPGSSGHIHISLWNDENNIFFDPNQKDSISDKMLNFIAGLELCLPQWLCMLAPSVNSFTRLVPGFWAPTAATWGIENRTCAIRAINGSEKSHRLELRVPGADANPYLALACALAAGLYGIEQNLQPSPAITGNAYEIDHPAENKFPTELNEAAIRLAGSNIAKQFFGAKFVEHFSDTRKFEQRQANQAITDWQLNRYMEII